MKNHANDLAFPLSSMSYLKNLDLSILSHNAISESTDFSPERGIVSDVSEFEYL